MANHSPESSPGRRLIAQPCRATGRQHADDKRMTRRSSVPCSRPMLLSLRRSCRYSREVSAPGFREGKGTFSLRWPCCPPPAFGGMGGIGTRLPFRLREENRRQMRFAGPGRTRTRRRTGLPRGRARISLRSRRRDPEPRGLQYGWRLIPFNGSAGYTGTRSDLHPGAPAVWAEEVA